MDKNAGNGIGQGPLAPIDSGAEIILLDETAGAVSAALDLPVLSDDGKLDDLPQGAVRQADGSVIYTLRHACAIRYQRKSDGGVREEAFPELHLHRLTGADMRAVSAAKGDTMTVVAIARSTRINEAKMGLIFDRMDGEDANAAMEIVSGFLGSGPKTGR